MHKKVYSGPSCYEDGSFRNGAWYCDCGELVTLFAPSDRSHRGRYSKRCAKPRHRKCSFFLWVHDEADAREKMMARSLLQPLVPQAGATSTKPADESEEEPEGPKRGDSPTLGPPEPSELESAEDEAETRKRMATRPLPALPDLPRTRGEAAREIAKIRTREKMSVENLLSPDSPSDEFSTHKRERGSPMDFGKESPQTLSRAATSTGLDSSIIPRKRGNSQTGAIHRQPGRWNFQSASTLFNATNAPQHELTADDEITTRVLDLLQANGYMLTGFVRAELCEMINTAVKDPKIQIGKLEKTVSQLKRELDELERDRSVA